MPNLSKSVDTGRIGAAVEHLVAASCILASDAVLNVSTSLVDDEGVDLVFHRRGRSATLAVQVKARSTDTVSVQGGKFLGNVRAVTFTARRDLYTLFVVVDRLTAALDTVFLVPSVDYDRLASTTGKGMRRIAASLKPDAQDKWRPYRRPFKE
ncbi:MAG: hypothetical protein H0U48_10035 [Euzebyaceae bacterium]|nr:hypothetical protein [Euzebyaceae bacterium]